MKEDLVQEFRRLVDEMRREGYTLQQLESFLHPETVIPAGIFATGSSPLQAIVTYLHDHLGKSFREISSLLHRSYRAVWGAYLKDGVVIAETHYAIPLSAFKPGLSILESVVFYLRGEGYRFTEIAATLRKDPRTVWTVNKRAEVKNARIAQA